MDSDKEILFMLYMLSPYHKCKKCSQRSLSYLISSVRPFPQQDSSQLQSILPLSSTMIMEYKGRSGRLPDWIGWPHWEAFRIHQWVFSTLPKAFLVVTQPCIHTGSMPCILLVQWDGTQSTEGSRWQVPPLQWGNPWLIPSPSYPPQIALHTSQTNSI